MRTIDSAAVVGAGPCGVAAAIQLKRSGVTTLVFEYRAVGGLLQNANLVENYPGFSRGIAGPRLCRLLERHLRAAGLEPVIDRVLEVVPRDGGFVLRAESGREYSVGAVVVATGTRPRTGLLPGEEALAGRRIFYEVRDVLSHASGGRTAILGAGDAAHDYALNLASKGFTVSLLQRSPPRCLPLLAERVDNHIDIHRLEEVSVTGCREVDGVLEILLKRGDEALVHQADWLLIACGRRPADDLLSSLRKRGGALPDGIYTGGDLIRGDFRQAGIAVGDGLRAAMAAAERLARDF